MTALLLAEAVKHFLTPSLEGLHVGAKIKPLSSPYLNNEDTRSGSKSYENCDLSETYINIL